MLVPSESVNGFLQANYDVGEWLIILANLTWQYVVIGLIYQFGRGYWRLRIGYFTVVGPWSYR